MTLNIDDVDHDVLDALRNRGHSDGRIGRMSVDEAFDEYCEWHGLPGWGSLLRRVLRNLRLVADKGDAS